jgi:hypothetical protein
MQSYVDLIGKPFEDLGNAWPPKLDCADRYEMKIQTQAGLCTLGFRAHTRASRYFKQSPCHVDEISNGLIAPQYECMCDGRANIMHKRQKGVLDKPLWVTRAKSRR